MFCRFVETIKTKEMKINILGRFPEGYSGYGSIDKLDDYDVRQLAGLNLDEIWYWYSSAPYEGSGQLLMRRGNEYSLHDMGHCSCYGPTERANFHIGRTLKEIAESLSGEYMVECNPLLEAAGYKF